MYFVLTEHVEGSAECEASHDIENVEAEELANIHGLRFEFRNAFHELVLESRYLLLVLL